MGSKTLKQVVNIKYKETNRKHSIRKILASLYNYLSSFLSISVVSIRLDLAWNFLDILERPTFESTSSFPRSSVIHDIINITYTIIIENYQNRLQFTSCQQHRRSLLEHHCYSRTARCSITIVTGKIKILES